MLVLIRDYKTGIFYLLRTIPIFSSDHLTFALALFNPVVLSGLIQLIRSAIPKLYGLIYMCNGIWVISPQKMVDIV